MTVRAVSYDSGNDFVFRRHGYELAGICIDLWNETARQLGLTYTMELVDGWEDMFKSFSVNRSDIIVQRMDDNQVERYVNATK